MSKLNTDVEFAAALRISRRQLWKLLSRGAIPQPVRLGRSVRWRESDISAFIEDGCRMPETAGATQ